MAWVIEVGPARAKRLGIRDARSLAVYRACMYLGYGAIFIEELLNNAEVKGPEADTILQAALDLGMDESKPEVVFLTGR